jgi:hypothetical protein
MTSAMMALDDDHWLRNALVAAPADTALVIAPLWHRGELAALLAAKAETGAGLLRSPRLRAWLPDDVSAGARVAGERALLGLAAHHTERSSAARALEGALGWANAAPLVAQSLAQQLPALDALAARSQGRLEWAHRPKVDLAEALGALARRGLAPFSDLSSAGIWEIAALGGMRRPRPANATATLTGTVVAWRVTAQMIAGLDPGLLASLAVAPPVRAATPPRPLSDLEPGDAAMLAVLLGAGASSGLPHPRLEFSAWPGADLHGRSLAGADLSGRDLRGCDLRYCDLSGADLSGCDLREADFRSANLSGAILIGSRLFGADFRDSDLSYAEVDPAALEGTQR